MIRVIKCVLSEYCTIFMKMVLDVPTIHYAIFNLSLFTNMEMLVGLNAMMSLLKAIHSLIKFAKLKDDFLYDFITTIKICEGGVYMYCNNHSSFKGGMFTNFIVLFNFA
jgi:hypothetical protein